MKTFSQHKVEHRNAKVFTIFNVYREKKSNMAKKLTEAQWAVDLDFPECDI